MGAAGESGPLGAWHVATRGPDGWRIERVGPGGLEDHPLTAADYAASLPSRPRDDLVEPFLACGGTMAAFERREDGLRKALGVRVIPYRTQPVLVAQPLTADTDRREFAEVYPILARCEGLSRYHWGHRQVKLEGDGEARKLARAANLCGGFGASDLGPHREGLRADGSVLDGRKVIAVEVEEVVDLVVRREEPLRLAG